MGNWEILIENNVGDGAVGYENLVRQAVSETLAFEGMVCDGEISLLFVEDGEMRELNREYRDKDDTTDCLSFPQFAADEIGGIDVAGSYVIFGDIVINISKAEGQAMEYGHSIEREVAFLTVHSVLHLLGYDHMDEIGEGDMFARQEAILGKMGLGRGV